MGVVASPSVDGPATAACSVPQRSPASLAAVRDRFQKPPARPRSAGVSWLGHAAKALAVTGASAVAASRTLTPYLLTLKTPAERSLLNLFPVVGPTLQTLVGTSVLGCAASACVLATSLGTLTAARQSRSVGTSWGLAHASIGFALSPLLMPGAMAAGMPVTLLLGCALGLSAVLTSRLISGGSSWMGAIAGVTLTLAAAPMAAELALGAAAASVSAHIIGTVASGAIIATAYHLQGSWPRFVSGQTAYLERFLARTEDIRQARLDLPGAADPTVFGTNREVADMTAWCQLARRHGEPFGMVKALLQGPAGSGKTEMARGLANTLDAHLAIIDAPGLTLVGGSASAAANVLELFTQARELQRSTNRPVVLFFDEAETLFCDRNHMDGTTAETRERNQLVNVFLQCLDGAHKPPDDNLVVLAATNYVDRLDPAIRQRFLVGARLQAPGHGELARMFNAHLQRALQKSPLQHLYANTPIDPALTQRVADHAARQGWVGREVTSLVARVTMRLAGVAAGRERASLGSVVEEALLGSAPEALLC